MAEIGHGGKEVFERILEPSEAVEKIKGLKSIPIRNQIANEVINIAYGWFSPLEGFMGRADVDSVCKDMKLASGVVWSIPILLDLSNGEISQYGIKEGDTVLLTYDNNPMAMFEVE